MWTSLSPKSSSWNLKSTSWRSWSTRRTRKSKATSISLISKRDNWKMKSGTSLKTWKAWRTDLTRWKEPSRLKSKSWEIETRCKTNNSEKRPSKWTSTRSSLFWKSEGWRRLWRSEPRSWMAAFSKGTTWTGTTSANSTKSNNSNSEFWVQKRRESPNTKTWESRWNKATSTRLKTLRMPSTHKHKS